MKTPTILDSVIAGRHGHKLLCATFLFIFCGSAFSQVNCPADYTLSRIDNEGVRYCASTDAFLRIDRYGVTQTLQAIPDTVPLAAAIDIPYKPRSGILAACPDGYEVVRVWGESDTLYCETRISIGTQIHSVLRNHE